VSKERRLGRGLEALLGRLAEKTEPPVAQPPVGRVPNPSSPTNSPVAQPPSAVPKPVPQPPLGRVSSPSSPSAAHPAPAAGADNPPETQAPADSDKDPRPDEGTTSGLDDAYYGGLATAYEVPRSPARRPTLPGMGTVARSLGALAADHDQPDNFPPADAVAPSPGAAGPEAAAVAPHAGPLCVPIGQVESNPFQPRHDFEEDEIQSLCDSLRAHGLLQPIVVRRAGDGYQLVAGERRLRAAVKAGWSEVPVQVVEADDRQIAELALVENLQRKDLNPLEKAASFQRYLQEYDCTQEELAARLKLDRSTVSNFIRLLELPSEVQQSLRQGKITQGHARSLLPLGDEREQTALCRRIQEEGLSVRQTEALVQETIEQADAEPLSLVAGDGRKPSPRRPTSEHLAALEQEFRAALGVRVRISHTTRGKGKLVIHFTGHEEFERIRQHICGPGHPEIRSQAG
jgi:ParB family chromosome partitioning protein